MLVAAESNLGVEPPPQAVEVETPDGMRRFDVSANSRDDGSVVFTAVDVTIAGCSNGRARRGR